MRTSTVLFALLALIVATPAASSEPPGLRPAAHEQFGWTLEELARHLHSLGARWREHFHHRPMAERPLITFMLRHHQELELSAEQVRHLERLRDDFQREAIRRQADLRIAGLELRRLLDEDPVDLKKAEEQLREIERLRVDLRLARIRTIEEGRAQLTSEQRAKLRSLLSAPPHPRFRSGPTHRPGGTRL